MKIQLKRPWYDGAQLHPVNTSGTEVPDDAAIPSDALLWDGKDWVDQSERENIDFSSLKPQSARKPQAPSVVERKNAEAEAAKKKAADDAAKKPLL